MDQVTNVTSLPQNTAPVSPERAALERQKVGELAQQFESVMMLQMLRQMRQAMYDDEDKKEGLSAETMTDTVDQELALSLSRGGGIGIASTLIKALDRQVSQKGSGADAAAAVEPGRSFSLQPAAPQLYSLEPLHADAEIQGSVSSPYGWRPDPFTGAAKFHSGVDVAAAYGTSVPVAAAGRVVSAGDQGAYGTTIVVQHADGIQTRYAHLSAVNVAVGDEVEPGQEIGRVGQSGRATGPHLHFEVIRDGQRVDPTGSIALNGTGLVGLKLMGSDADFPVGGRVGRPSAAGAADENRGH